MKDIILSALEGTLIGDTAKLAETYMALSELAKNEGTFVID